jgi:hypothetical protein
MKAVFEAESFLVDGAVAERLQPGMLLRFGDLPTSPVQAIKTIKPEGHLFRITLESTFAKFADEMADTLVNGEGHETPSGLLNSGNL